jgi:hypothetical protein
MINLFPACYLFRGVNLTLDEMEEFLKKIIEDGNYFLQETHGEICKYCLSEHRLKELQKFIESSDILIQKNDKLEQKKEAAEKEKEAAEKENEMLNKIFEKSELAELIT